ncbi:putative G-protein coupled receptor 82 [Pelodytes ibericus]
MWNNSSCLKASRLSTVGLPIIYSVLFVLSMCGNLFTLWIFIKNIRKKTSTHIYLINLTISNVMVSTGMPFQIAYYANANNWHYNSTKCSVAVNASNILIQSSMCVSISIFCWIAISRYATLVRHEEKAANATQTSYEKFIFGQILKSFRKPKFAKCLCICVWIVILSPNVFLAFIAQDENSGKLCFNEDVEIGKQPIVICSIFVSACYCLFTIIVLLFYYFFIKHIKELQADSCIGEKYLIHGIVQRNITVIIGLLVVCFAPYLFSKFLLYGLARSCHLRSMLVEIKNVLLILAEFRSCSDPIVYLCLDEVFKRNIQSLFSNSPGIQLDSTANKRNTTQGSTTNAMIKQRNEISKSNAISDIG